MLIARFSHFGPEAVTRPPDRPSRPCLDLETLAMVLARMIVDIGGHMRARGWGVAYALVMAAAALFGSGAWAQTAVKIVMPAPAGGAGDIVARILAEQVGRAQGLTLVIENRPGAGTIIGTEAVARAAPDGTTLL